MKAAKYLAVRHRQMCSKESCSGHEQLIKTELLELWSSMARQDKILSSLFRVESICGIGSFGIVMEGRAIRPISVKDLALAQRSKQLQEPKMKIPKNKLISQRRNQILLQKNQLVAIKFEHNYTDTSEKFYLPKEFSLLVKLYNVHGASLLGFAKPYLFGCIGNATMHDSITSHTYSRGHFLVMELLGRSLKDLFENEKMADPIEDERVMAKIFDYSRQLILRLKTLHSERIAVTHNDLKLDQLVMGTGDKAKILHIIDLGLCTSYKEGKLVTWGNRRYSSRFRQDGIHSPLTDLESASYVIARMIDNQFPWDLSSTKDSAKGSKLKIELWKYVERVRHGACSMNNSLAWQRRYFTSRLTARGDGGKQLLAYMSDLLAYYSIDQLLPAESIDYERLSAIFNIDN